MKSAPDDFGSISSCLRVLQSVKGESCSITFFEGNDAKCDDEEMKEMYLRVRVSRRVDSMIDSLKLKDLP